MVVLLTGANGNLAQEILKQSLSHFVKLNKEDSEFLDKKFFSNVDVILHAAADLHSQVNVDPINFLNSNLLLTAKLLEGAKKHKISRFVYISSSAVYGRLLDTSEDRECAPIGFNGMVKLLNEKIVVEYCLTHKIKYQILRVFNLYGGNDQFSIFSHLKKSLETGHPFILNNNGVAHRDFIHVSDAAKITSFILDNDIDCKYLNVGTGSPVKISLIIDWLRNRFPNFQYINYQADEIEYSCANITKLSKLIHFNFKAVEDFLSDYFYSEN